MTGLDFLQALHANGVDLPVRVFFEKPVTNLYNPNRLCFCNLSIEDDEEVTPNALALLCGKNVYVVHDEATKRVRDVTKVIKAVEPWMLTVVAGNVFTSWTHQRGWDA